MDSEPDIAVVGPMARSGFDLETMLRILAHPDHPDSAIRYDLPTIAGRSLADFRVALWRDDEVAPVSREISQGVDKVAQVFRDAGATVVDDADLDLPAPIATTPIIVC